jgi:hypothetical protein
MKKYCILAITKEDGESFNSAWLMCDVIQQYQTVRKN